MQSWKEHEIIHQDDDTFIIIKNGFPYHLPNFGEFKKEYGEVKSYIKEHPEQVVENKIGPTEEEILEQEKQNKIAEFENVISEQKSLLIDFCIKIIMEQMMVSTISTDTYEETINDETTDLSLKTIKVYNAMNYNRKCIKNIKEMTSVDAVKNEKPIFTEPYI